MKAVTPPILPPAQQQSWTGLLDLADSFGTTGWSLVGGQLVHLHCWERDASPNRPTNDGDTVVDVRSTTGGLRRLTAALADLGFNAARETLAGKEFRWVRDLATIDVLVPTRTSTFADNHTVNRMRTIEAPGAQQALDRTEVVPVDIAGRIGRVPRPNLLGALVVKAAAYCEIPVDTYAARHLQDFAVLASLAGRRDLQTALRARDRQRLRAMVAAMRTQRSAWIAVDGAEEGVERIHARLTVVDTGDPSD